jgi:hypothetical protein
MKHHIFFTSGGIDLNIKLLTKLTIMKSKLIVLLVAIGLPLLASSQQFNVAGAFNKTDDQLFARELYKHSVLLQTLEAALNKEADINDEQARQLVRQRLEELNDPRLNALYDQVKPADIARIGIILYLLMSGVNNVPDQYDMQLGFGTGFGFFLMYTLANFVLMPELFFALQGFTEKDGSYEVKTRFSQIALSLTMLYLIKAQTLSFVLGIAPQFFYNLSGKVKEDGEPDEDIEFGGEYGARRLQMYLGLTAGIMLQQGMMIRFMYSLGLNKIYKNGDPKLYYLALILSVPLWNLK